MKRRISLMIAVILVLQIILPMVSVIWESDITIKSIAASEIKSGDWSYTVNEDGNTITITEYRGTDETLVIPDKIDNYIVTKLGNGRNVDSPHNRFSVFYFSYCIDTIELPSTMKEIGSFAFYGCTNLTNIILNEGLETLGNQILFGCKKLKTVYIPGTVTLISDNGTGLNPFYECNSLESITVNPDNQYYSSDEGVLFNKEKNILIAYPEAKVSIDYYIPDSVNKIYGHAINNNNLKNLYISANTNEMDGEKYLEKHMNISSILGCTNLQNITVDALNEKFSSENGILYNKDKTELLFYPPAKTDTYYNIPNTINSCKNVSNTYIETIRLNSIITEIDFLKDITNLKNIQVDSENPNYIQKNGVLYNKEGDKLIYYPIGRTEETYTIDSSATQIASNAFRNSKLKEINLSNNIKSIPSYAFYNCKELESIELPSDITEIGQYAFYNCESLDKIIIPKNVTTIGQYGFYHCESLNELIFEANSKLEQIGNEAFTNCSSLEEIHIPEGVTNIDVSDGCSNLRIIDIPSTVSNIPGYCFNSHYTRGQIITINNENPTIFGGWAFQSPEVGITIIRCKSTATDVINWANSKGRFHYNLIDLDEQDQKFLYTVDDNNEVTILNYIGDEETIEIPSQLEGYPVTKIVNIYGTYKNLTIPSTVEKICNIYSRNLENIGVDDENKFFSSKDGVLFNKDETQLIYYPMGRKETSYSIPEGVVQIGGNDYVSIGSTRYTGGHGFKGNIYLENLSIPKTVNIINDGDLTLEGLSKILVDHQNINYISKDNILYENKNGSIKIKCVPKKVEGSIELLYGLNKIDTYTFSNEENIRCIIAPTTVTKIEHNAFYHCDNLEKLVIPPNTELAEINDANLSFGSASTQLKVYCEAESTAQIQSRKWNINYEIITPTKIEIKQEPEKLSYIKNEEELNLEGGLITITYDDGTKLDLAMESNLLNITGFNNSTVGNKQIEVNYKGQKTSFIVNIVGESGEEELQKGDANGDGKVDFNDILAINKHRLGKVELTGANLEASDVTGDGQADFSDILQINKYRLGKINSL